MGEEDKKATGLRHVTEFLKGTKKASDFFRLLIGQRHMCVEAMKNGKGFNKRFIALKIRVW